MDVDARQNARFRGEIEKARKAANLTGLLSGAESRNRTGTISQSADFESAASTNFATSAEVV